MSLRVLDDDRPGFALLQFGSKLEQPSLSISIRSLRENAFLGPEGKFQRAAYYFTADRVGDTPRGTEYRVGPEIVNHLLEHDQIIVATADGSVREEALWENAVPQMPGAGGGHSIYRPPPVAGTEGLSTRMAVLRPEPVSEPPPRMVAPPPEPTSPPPAPPPPPPPEAPVVVKAEPPPKEDIVPPVPTPPSNRLKFIALAAIPVVLIGLFAVPQVRCSLFGMSCPVPTPTKDLLTPAMACATERKTQRPCDVKACFDAYLADTAARDIAPQVTAAIDGASKACPLQQENDALQKARQCAAGSNPCNARTCYDGYMARFGNTGTYSGDARREIAALQARCPAAIPSPARPRAMPDGTYGAGTLAGCNLPPQPGITISVTSGTVSWQHEFKGTRYSWRGTVDDNGFIRATAGPSLSATGRYSDSQRDIQMQYPECGPEGITLDIIGRR